MFYLLFFSIYSYIDVSSDYFQLFAIMNIPLRKSHFRLYTMTWNS